MELYGKIIIEEASDAIVVNGKIYVAVMDVPDEVVLGDKAEPERKVADDAKPPAKKAAAKSTTTTKKAPAKKTTKKAAPKKDVVAVDDWAVLEEGDEVKIKFGEDFLEEGDDPERLYNARVTKIGDDDSEPVIEFLDDDMQDEGKPIEAELEEGYFVFVEEA